MMSRNRNSFSRYSVMVLILSLLLGLGNVLWAKSQPAGASSQQIGSDTIFFKLSTPTTLYTGTSSSLQINAGTTTSTGHGFVFPKDTKITISLPNTRGVLFNSEVSSDTNFTYTPSNSRRTLTVSLKNDLQVEYFDLNIALLATNSGTFTNNKQVIDAGTIVATFEASSINLNLTQKNEASIEVNNIGSGITTGTLPIASGPGTATAVIRGNETLSLKVSSISTNNLTMNDGYETQVRFWSTSNPFTIPRNSTLTLTLPSNSPVIFSESYANFGEGSDYFKASLSADLKTLVMTAVNDLTNSDHTITVSLKLDGGRYDSSITNGGKMTAELKLNNVTVNGSWPSATLPDDIPVSIPSGSGESTWTNASAASFNPSTLQAIVPFEALDALTGAASYQIVLDAGIGNLPAKQIALSAMLFIPEGASMSLEDMSIGSLQSHEGYTGTASIKEFDEGVQIDVVVNINTDYNYELRSITIPIEIESFLINFDYFGDQPLTASLVTNGTVLPHGSSTSYKLNEKIAYIVINVPPAYTDEDAGDEDSIVPLMRYQGLLRAKQNPVTFWSDSAISTFRSIIALSVNSSRGNANQTLQSISGDLSVGMLRPFGVLPGLLRVTTQGLTIR